MIDFAGNLKQTYFFSFLLLFSALFLRNITVKYYKVLLSCGRTALEQTYKQDEQKKTDNFCKFVTGVCDDTVQTDNPYIIKYSSLSGVRFHCLKTEGFGDLSWTPCGA